MTAIDLRIIARALCGEVTGGKVIAPGPGHGPKDRSLWVIPSWQAPNGFRVHCFSPKDDWREARDYVAARLGMAPDAWKQPQAAQQRPVAPSPVSNDDVARTARAAAIWQEARAPRGTLAEIYLRSRGLDLTDDVAGAVLRFHPACPWRDEERQQTIRVPAMVAAMRAINGDAITGVQRTRLSSEGCKLDRRMLGIAAGSAVKLDDDAEVTMGLAVGEGSESVLAARQLGFRPAWALGSAGAIAAFPVLAGVECLTLLAENDLTNARAVDTCAQRWHAAGREVIVVEPKGGNDINDAIWGAA